MTCFHCNPTIVPTHIEMNDEQLFCGGEAICVCDTPMMTLEEWCFHNAITYDEGYDNDIRSTLPACDLELVCV